MGRAIAWVLLGAGLIAAAAFLLLDPTGGHDPLDAPGKDEPSAQPGAALRAPSLHAAGRRPEAIAGAGTYVVRGRVVDERDVPAGALPVDVYRVGRARGPAGGGATAGESVARFLATMADPQAAEPTLVATVETDAQGAFVFLSEEPARYECRARPPPPAVGTYSQVSLHDGRPEGEVTLHVMEGSALVGRVLDARDGPVAASLKARWWSRGEAASRNWTSGLFENDPQDGSFRIAAVPTGMVYFAVYVHGGPKLTGISVQTPHEGELLIRVPSGGGVVQGKVTDPEGRPVPGTALVLVVTSPKEAGGVTSSARSTSNAAGVYRLEGLPAGLLARVEALAEGFLPLTQGSSDAPWQGAEVVPGKPLDLDLVLRRGGRVHGRVLVRGSGRPLAGATVSVLPARRGSSWPRVPVSPATTDAAGDYSLQGLPVGRYVLLPRHPDHYLAELARPGAGAYGPGMAGASAPAALTIVVTGDETDLERDLELVPGLVLRGRVVDSEGRGVQGAWVQARGYGVGQVAWAWGVGGHRPEPLATSGEDGAFEARGLPPRDDWVLYARKEGYVGSFSDPLALTVGGPTPSVELTLLVGAVVRGRVTGGDDELVARARVGAWGEGMELSPAAGRSRRVEPDGRFEITDLPPGDRTLTVWVDGAAGTQREVNGLAAGEVREGILLELREGVEVSGVLVDAQGRGLPGVSLTLQALGGGMTLHAVTDAQGAFRFRGVEPGQVQLSTSGGTGGSRRLGAPFEAPRANLRFVHEKDPVVTIGGRVLDPSGEPVPFAIVQVRPAADGNRGDRGWAYGVNDTTEAVDGGFRIRVSGKPPYAVVVKLARDEEGRTLNVQEARELVRDASRPVVIRLQPGLEVSGRVLDARARGMAGVGVSVGGREVRTSADGRFTLTGLSDGQVFVHVRPVPGYVTPPWQQVPAGTKGLEFRLRPGVRIRGQAFDASEQPLTRGYASGRWEATADGSAGSAGSGLDPQGRFVLDGIPEDVTVRVEVQSFARSGVSQAPAVVEGVRPGTEDLVVRLGRGLSISGVVVDHEGRPVARCMVAGNGARGPPRSTVRVQTAEDGTWMLAGLQPGRYVVHLQAPAGSAAPPPQEIDAPATGVRFVLPRSATLYGRVEGLEPEAATRWRVRVWRADGSAVKSGRLNPDGSWNVGAVPADASYLVGAQYWRDGRYAAAGPLRPRDAEIVLRLQQGRSIRGVVDLSVLGPEAACSVVAKSDSWQAPGFVDKTTGRFEINGLPPGRYGLMATSHDGAYLAVKPNVEAGAQGVALLLAPR